MQMNKIESTKKVKMLDMKMDNLKVSKQRAQLTNTEIAKLDPETKVYSSVGRMFVLSNIPELASELKKKEAGVDDMMVQCTKNKEILLQNLKDQEDQLRELVQQKREK
jgi:prefoldin subunit 1